MSFVAAVDLGATSGRVIVFGLVDGLITSEEIHRFANQPQWVGDRLVWDFEYLYGETTVGVQQAAARYPLRSSGVDSWAVDYGVIDKAGELLGPVYAYRDPKHEEGLEEFYTRISWPEHYSIAGIQKIALNTVYQLTAEAETRRIRDGYKVLLIPDLIAFKATGHIGCEITNASHTAMLDANSHTWSAKITEAARTRFDLMAKVTQPGADLGNWRVPGLQKLPLVAVASHDTGSAFVAVPFSFEKKSLVVNLGTWALVGTELSNPILSDAAREANFTNEVGYGSTTRFLKNVTGMWLLEQVRNEMLTNGQTAPIEELLIEMQSAPEFAAWINPDDPLFGAPGGMVSRIASNAEGITPQSRGEFVRCVLESLIARIAQRIDSLSEITNTAYQEIVAVGGGSRMAVVCQWLADATQIPVSTGPTEATALGNAIVQWLANGDLGSIQEARSLVKAMSDSRYYVPTKSQARWLPLIAAMP